MEVLVPSPDRYAQLLRWHKYADLLFNRYRFPGSRKLYRRLSRLKLPRLTQKQYTPTIFGFDMVVGPENAYDYYYLGFYEMGLLNFFKSALSEGSIFVDVGANIGLMSFFASKLVGENGAVIAVEPTRKYFEDLDNGITRNGFKNVQTFKIGLGSAPGSLPIYHNEVCPSMIKTADSDPSEIVEVKTLDKLLEEQSVKAVDLIKIDVEGFELEVVKGGKGLFSGTSAPVACIEYVRDQQMITENGKTALHLLRELNDYRFFQLENTSDTIGLLKEVKDFTSLHANDNVFCLLDDHVEKYGGLIR